MIHSNRDFYSEYCAAVEQEIVELLGRELTPREKSAIWNIGSMMMLEGVERDLLAATTVEAIEAELEATAQFVEQRKRD